MMNVPRLRPARGASCSWATTVFGSGNAFAFVGGIWSFYPLLIEMSGLPFFKTKRCSVTLLKDLMDGIHKREVQVKEEQRNRKDDHAQHR